MAAPLVFDLLSKVTGRHSTQRVEVKNVRMYESGNVEFIVQNPFPNDVEFWVTMENLESLADPGARYDKIKKSAKSEGKDMMTLLREMGKIGSSVPAFFLSQEKIRIRRKGQTKMKLVY
jgi:hypothetical protein